MQQSNATLRSVVVCQSHGVRILEFLKKNEGQEFNCFTLEKSLNIPQNILRAELSRLSRAGLIWKPQRGFYSGNCTLNEHQIKRIEKDLKMQFHNISIKIPKEFPKGTQQTPPTVPPNEAKIETDSNTRKKVIEMGANRTMTIVEYPENFLVMIGCSENPLDISEFLIVSSHLKSIFNEEAVDKGIIVKIDINNDLPITFSPNQITFGDVSRMCFAIYNKGIDKTRLEIRNFGLKLPVRKFLQQVTALLETEAEAPKTIEPIRPHPPISEFRTGLQILIDRAGYKALDDMRANYKAATAARLSLNERLNENKITNMITNQEN